MIGDATLFHRADMIEETWRVVQPVLDAWAKEKAAFPNYASGSDGPAAADELIGAAAGRHWRPVTRSSEAAP
jgi:glucose-6-phosphate 1-dehydrogenase